MKNLDLLKRWRCLSFSTILAENFNYKRFKHAGICFQALVHQYFKLMCFSIGVFAKKIIFGRIINLDLLLSTGFNSELSILFKYLIFRDQCMIERLNKWLWSVTYFKEKGNSRKFLFSHTQTVVVLSIYIAREVCTSS